MINSLAVANLSVLLAAGGSGDRIGPVPSVSKDYGYARFWAGALTVLGTLFVLLGFLVAVAAILIPAIGGFFPRRGNEVLAGVVMAILAVLAGALIGGPLIVAGQSLRVMLAQRRLLARLNRHLARRSRSSARRGGGTTL
jgi:hypothetical protein